MNTYALSNCLTLSPEPFVSYKGQNTKVRTDITFLRRQISVQENRFCWIDFHTAKTSMLMSFFLCKHNLSLWLNEFHGETICESRP